MGVFCIAGLRAARQHKSPPCVAGCRSLTRMVGCPARMAGAAALPPNRVPPPSLTRSPTSPSLLAL
eukprot:364225-Chlamydomonas_euryale.AAC.7